MSMIYGDGFIADRFARLGDSIECDVRQPTPGTIRMKLETHEAVAYANDLLMREKTPWRLSRRVGVDSARAVVGDTVAAKFEKHVSGVLPIDGNAKP